MIWLLDQLQKPVAWIHHGSTICCCLRHCLLSNIFKDLHNGLSVTEQWQGVLFSQCAVSPLTVILLEVCQLSNIIHFFPNLQLNRLLFLHLTVILIWGLNCCRQVEFNFLSYIWTAVSQTWENLQQLQIVPYSAESVMKGRVGRMWS